ncbi:MAG: TonB-dependent receptor [Nonlabens sp.]
MHRVLCVFCIWAFLAQSQAQNCNYAISGVVQDFHDGQALELAQIYILPIQRTTSTDENGRFKITGLCAGTYKLRISHVSCETKNLEIELDGNRELTIKLEHHVNELDNVKVLADVHDEEGKTNSSQQITSETITDYSGATLGDALSTVKGVTVLKTGNSVTKPMIHGLYGSRVAIVNNGLRQQDQEWGVEHAPNIDLNTAENIQVIKGASALRYGGDAVGGTIVINPRRILAKDTLMGRAILTGQSNGRGGTATATINNFNKSGWYQQATLTAKRLGDYESPDYILSNTGSETYATKLTAGFRTFEYGFELGYSFYNANIGILRSAHIGNTSDLVRSINSGRPSVINDFTYDIDPPKQEVFHHSVTAKAFKRFSNFGKVSLDYGFQFNNRLEFDIRRGSMRGQASLDMDLLTNNLAAHVELDKYDDFKVEAGIDFQLQTNTPDPDTGVRRLIPDYDSYRTGAFTSIQYTPDTKWSLEAGLRYDYFDIAAQKFYIRSRWESLGYDTLFPEFERRDEGIQIFTEPEFDYHLLAFTTGVRYNIDEGQFLSLNLSTANRAPNPSELFSDGLHHALATIELGRLDLDIERSHKFNVVYHLSQAGLDFEINPHINLINNFVQLEPNGVELTTRGAFPVYSYRQTDARLYGVDAGLSYTLFSRELKRDRDREKKYPGELSELISPLLNFGLDFSYIHGTDTILDRPLIDMPPAQLNFTTAWYNAFFQGLTLDMRVQQVWEQNRFPDLDFETAVISDDGMLVMEEVQISQPPQSYALLDVGLGYAFAKAELRLSVQNVLNNSYRNYLNRLRFYSDDVGRNINLQLIYKI